MKVLEIGIGLICDTIDIFICERRYIIQRFIRKTLPVPSSDRHFGFPTHIAHLIVFLEFVHGFTARL